MIRLAALEGGQRCGVIRVQAEVDAGIEGAVLFEILPAASPVQADAEKRKFAAHAVFVREPVDVFKEGKFVAAVVEQLDGGEGRAVLVGAAVAQKELEVRLRKQRE